METEGKGTEWCSDYPAVTDFGPDLLSARAGGERPETEVALSGWANPSNTQP
jgi:hypothetical protein